MDDDLDQLHLGPSKAFIAGVTGVVLLVALAGYALHEHHVTENLSAQNTQLTASLNANRSQLNQLTAAVNQLNAQQQQEQAQQAAAAAAKPTPYRRSTVHHRRARYEDSRYSKLQSQVDAQGREIQNTQNDLANTRTQLTGSIAKNHTELVLLEKKGERNYSEFDIWKSKEFQNHDDVGVRLRKANVKHQYADLELLVDDRELTQKHVNLYQPIMFYTPDSPQPVELVINDITKNHIHGYVSAPKYSKSELAAMSNAQPSANGDIQPPPRQKLTVSPPQQ
ncbi:MAG TPA: hypothetical protein VME86_08875 [Acidobacteriaceae bacterium]|nr:hypothetical protein [Acidobacteriaceae bacterium]